MINSLFKDWRICSQDLKHMPLDPSRFYYIQAQAWALKGYAGGTHSWCTFYESNKWLVIELTDRETLSIQKANIIYDGPAIHDQDHAPFITDRPYNAQWFGHDPFIVDSCPMTVSYSDILYCAKQYPIRDFVLINQNCNTFTSYLIWKLNLNLHRPLRSIGFKNKKWWQKNHGT